MANKDTRILKSNTLEELRQKSNEISLHLGDNDQLNVNVNDKTFNFVDVSAGTSLFHNIDDASKVIDFEIKPEESLDNTAGYIILKGSPTIPAAFSVGSSITQSGGYSATIVSATSEKILVKNSTGVFNSTQNLIAGSGSISASNVVRQVAEGYPVGVVRVYKNNVELVQDLSADGFHVVNLSGKIPLANNPTITDFTEGSTVYQGTNLGSATFSGVILRATSTILLLKSYTGSLNPSTQIKLDGSSSTITGANHGALINIIESFGNAIELNTPAAANDDIKIHGPTIVDAVNELQDDVGVIENLESSLGNNIVSALNNIEAVFDASTKEISAGSNAFNVTSGTFTIDSAGDVILDSNSGNITLKAGPTTFGQLDNSSGNILIQSGTSTMLTGSGANATFAQDITVTRDVDIDRNLNVDGNTTLDGTTIDGNLQLNGILDVSSDATVNGNTILVGNLNTRGANFLGNGTGDDTTISGDLIVNVNATVTGATQLNGGLTMDTDKFVVENDTGNTSIAGTLDVDGDTTLDETRIDGDLDLNGSVNVSTNADIVGNLDVDGATTLDETRIDGNLDLNGSANISGILEVVGNLTIGSLDTVAQDVKGSLNELDGQVGLVTFPGPGGASDTTTTLSAVSPSNLTAALVALDHEIGDTDIYNDGTYGASTIADTLQALQTGVINNDTNIADLFADVGSLSLDTGAGDLTAAVNELHGEINSNDTDIGNIMKLIDGQATVDSSISFTGLAGTNLKAAVVELAAEKLNLNTGGTTGAIGRINAGSDSVQDVISRLTLTGDVTFKPGSDISGANSTNANRFTFNTGTILDLSNLTGGSLLLPGSASSVNIFSASFLEVDGNVETPMGFSVDRAHVTQTNKSDVRIQWNENHTDGTSATKPARGWQLQGLNDTANSNTADIVTFYNAKELITNNTESGINVTWDSTAQNFDFNVNDPTIQLSGDVVGSATMTDLGNVNISTVIQPNSVALGTDTTGNYIKTLTGTQYQVTVTPAAHTEGKDAVLSIPTDFRMPGTAKVLSTTNSTSKTTGALTVAGGVGINDDLYVGGDLVVQGDTVTLNTETLTVEDTLVLAGNNLSSEPSSGGFGLEVGPITSPSGVASGVTGAHSIVYNYTTDQWEADGSLILSNATNTPPTIESNAFGAGKNLDFNSGTGINVTTTTSGNDIDVTITNTLDGYSGWFLSTQGTNRGNIADDERVDFHGADALTVSYDTTNTNRVLIDHDDIGPGAGTIGQPGTEDGTYLKSITLDKHGHVTAVTSDDFDDRYDNYGSWIIKDGDTTAYTITSGDTLQITGGAGLTSNFTGDDILEIKHNDTSSVGNLNSNNSGNTFIQDLALTFDGFGHVTGATASTGTVSVGNGTLTLTGGGGIITTIGDFTANQTSNETLTIAHADTSSQGSVDNSGNNVIQDVTLDTYGHVTGLVSKEITAISGNAGSATTLYVTADDDGPNNVSQNYPLTYINAGGSAYRSFYEDDSLVYNPHQNILTAGTFNGAVAYANVTGKPTIGDGTVTLAGGVALHINETDKNFSMNQTGNQTITIDHDDITRTDPQRTSATPGYGGTFEIIDGSAANNGITTNSQGHVTAVATKQITMPSAQSIPSVGNGTVTIDPDSYILVNDSTSTNQAFSMNQTNNETIKIGVNATSADTASTVVARDASADINARAFRSSLGNGNSGIGFMMTQVNTTAHDQSGSDNYIRPSTKAQVLSFLNVADGAGVNTDRYVNSASFSTSNGVLTLTRAGSDTGTVTVDLDGRYLTSHQSLPNGFSTITFGGTDCVADSTSDTFTITGGNGISLTGNSNNDSGTISVSTDQRGNIYQFGRDTNDYVVVDSNSVDFYLDGARDMTLENDGDLHVRANITAYSTTITSDQKLKENVQVVNGALEKVSQLDGVTFDWKDGSGKSAGVIAQNVESVLPSAVSEVENMDKTDTHKVVDYNQLSALFIEAIKELKEENKLLRSEIEGLKSINS